MRRTYLPHPSGLKPDAYPEGPRGAGKPRGLSRRTKTTFLNSCAAGLMLVGLWLECIRVHQVRQAKPGVSGSMKGGCPVNFSFNW